MKKRMPLFLAAIILILLLLAWAPWQTAQSARAQAEQKFAAAWENVADGCGLACNGCGAKAAQKALGGYLVTLEYACGMLPADSPEYHRTVQVYISFLGTVQGLPQP